MIPPHIYYQLAILGLLWFCILGIFAPPSEKGDEADAEVTCLYGN